MNWKHPTGKVPESVLICALGPTKHDLIEAQTKHEPQSDLMDADEYWGVNAGVNWFGGRVAYDMLWVMDYLEGEARKHPAYVDRIVGWSKRFKAPVMTSEAGRFASDLVREFPIKAVFDHFGPGHAYFRNSIPYLIAYAVFIGVKRLTLFGVDYNFNGLHGREDDKANCEYWIGAARSYGVTVVYPQTSSILRANEGTYFYGYSAPTELPPPLVTAGG